MIIAKMQGGMGNQMFQYAFGRYLSLKHNTTLKLDVRYLLDRTPRKEFFVFRDYDLDIFNLQVEFASAKEVEKLTHWAGNEPLNKVARKLVGRKTTHIFEPHHPFYEPATKAGKNAYLEGYWQTEKYFSSIRNVLKTDFTVKEPLGERAKEMMGHIQATDAVCVNVRRGDFLISTGHGTCDAAYYATAEEIVHERTNNPQFFVFSDEIDWCRENLSFSGPTTFVGHEYAGSKFQDYLRLMSACRNFIIPNSSFAWWAVYLNDNRERTVIAPKNWVADERVKSDVHLPGWIKI